MTLLVTYSADPAREPRHVLAVAAGDMLATRPRAIEADLLRGELFAIDAAQKLAELRALSGPQALPAWLTRQGVAVGSAHVPDGRPADAWFRTTLPGDAHFIYDVSHSFAHRVPAGWFEAVAARAREHGAGADHPYAGVRAVHCLVRRTILDPMPQAELAALRAEVREALEALEGRSVA